MPIFGANNKIVFVDTTIGNYILTGSSASGISSSYVDPTKIIGIFEPLSNGTLQYRIPSQSFGTTKNITGLYLSASSNSPKVGIGTTNPLGAFDIRSSDPNVAPNLTLRTNNDDIITIGEETGKLRFLIESSSFNLAGLDLAISGSTAEIFSRVSEIDSSGVKGNLVFGLSAATTTNNIDAFTLGYNATSNLATGDIHAVLSGSAIFTATLPKLILNRNSQTFHVAEIGSISAGASQYGGVILRNDISGDINIRFSADPTQASYISGAGNFGIGTTSPTYPLSIKTPENNVAEFVSTDTVSQLRIADSSGTPFYFGVIGTTAYITPTGATPADGLGITSAGNVGIGIASPNAKLHISQSATNPGLLVDGGSAGNLVAKFRRTEGVSPSVDVNLGIHFSDSDSQIRFEPATETKRWSIGASNADPGNFEFAPDSKISGNEVIYFNRVGGIYAASITSSGNISSSNNIYATSYYTDGYEALSRSGDILVFSNVATNNQYKGASHNFGAASITASIVSASGAVIADTLTGSLNIPNDGTLGIGQQTFYPHGANGFSVNEDFDASNSSTQTAYHFTSGDNARDSVVFSLARTSGFTNMFGITGSSSDNKFVIGAEFANTDFEFRSRLGIQPVQLQSGSLLARLNRSGSFYVSNDITASGDISASGQFIGANFGLDSSDKLQFSTATLQIRLSNTSKYTITPTIFRPTDDEGASLGRSANKWKELVVNHITASGNISASGTIVGSNLSGTNTGDQDLSSYIQNSQTSSMSVATASYVAAANIDGTIDISDQTNLAGGTNLTLSGDTMNLDANISLTSITASGDISASGAVIASNVVLPTNGAIGLGALDEDYISFGPNIIINSTSGTAILRGQNGQTIGTLGNIAPTEIFGYVSASANSGHHIFGGESFTVIPPITASGGISASFLEAGTTDANGGAYSTVMVDTATGRFYHTGSYGGGGGGSGTVTEVTVGTGLDVTNGTTTPNITLDLTEVITSDGSNRVLTSNNNGTLTAEADVTYDGSTLQVIGNIDISTGQLEFIPALASSYSTGIYSDPSNTSTIPGFTADGTVGYVEYMEAPNTSTLTLYDIVYLNNSTAAWSAAQANAESTSINLLGLVTKGGTYSKAMTRGYIRVPAARIAGANLANPSVYGDPLYLSTGSAGYFQQSTPITNNHVIRCVGHIVNYTLDRSNNVSSWVIKFDPSPDYIVN